MDSNAKSANNAYSLLAAWLRYQRDIGVEGVIFGHDSVVRKVLAGGAARGGVSYQNGGASAVVAQKGEASVARGASRRTEASWRAPAPIAGGAMQSPLSRLSKIKPINALDAGMLERKRRGVAAPETKVSSERRRKLAGLYREVLGCNQCALSTGRAKVVFGAGSADGRLFVAGGSPDLPDDRAGLPFQGEAGELLDKILGKMGLDRKNDIFASYLQKCRDGGDGSGGGAGFDSGCAGICRSIFDKQIGIIEPRVLLVFGEGAAKFLLGSDEDIEKLRGVNHAYLGVPVVVTYGLQLMIKETSYRKGAWIDMERVLGMIR